MSTAEVQLARVEGGRLVRNPALWLAVLVLVPWVRAARRDGVAGEGQWWLLVGYGLVLPGFVVLAITVLAVLRSRQSGTDELFAAVPVTADRRTVGHGWSTLTGGLVGVGLTAVLLAYFRPGSVAGRVDSTSPRGVDLPRPSVAQLLQGPLAVVVVAALGLALVRWVPSWLVLVPLAFAAMNQFLFAGVWSGTPTTAASWWFPLSSGWVVDEWVGCGDGEGFCQLPISGFDRVTPWWHLGYLAALAVLFVVVAVLRHRRDRGTWAALAVALAAVVGFAVAQVVVFERFTAAGV